MPAKTVMGTAVPMDIKTPENHCRASQERTLPDSPATIEKAFGELLDERFGQAPGSATPPCGIGWRNVQTGIPGKLRRQEIYSPLAVFPIVQIHGKSGTASGKRTSITTGCPGFGIYLSGFLVAFLHAADRLGLLFVQVQNINHILPFFRNGAGTYSLN